MQQAGRASCYVTDSLDALFQKVLVVKQQQHQVLGCRVGPCDATWTICRSDCPRCPQSSGPRASLRAPPPAPCDAGRDKAHRGGRQRAEKHNLLAVLAHASPRRPMNEASHLDATEPIIVRAGIGVADHLQKSGLALPLAAHEHDLHDLAAPRYAVANMHAATQQREVEATSGKKMVTGHGKVMVE